MKIFTIILFSCFSTFISAQICSCSETPYLDDLISCKTTAFQNGTKIYWEFDCNSSWITFQNGALKKKIFELDKDEMEFSGRLGYKSWTEFGNSFLIENSVVSGCCQPDEYILYDKITGDKISDLGTLVFIEKIGEKPFVLTIKNNDDLIFTNLNDNKSYVVKIPKDKIAKTLENSNELYAENLFGNVQIKNGLLSIELKYKISKKRKWKKEIITFDVNKAENNHRQSALQ
ncbi:hypothetical protein NG800_013610 [Epilithonimonas ginsengisoli]|uniref:Uncharacterized protein n=1 Tax=Epilithonimonas ginsengisoli TaxID=1245592 RepID=A0ABU4JJZ2_9FLAO|nr:MULTISPECIES: hypothetical protein [Chryseobacterium group]MBV6881059.1 hypothetical protein [Epilithonimonas sp. FP105]MDW8549956.1 hypothetical protein [Epilithonimonas ginsengisoli]OAH76533.1 hypothetical protein AXA65_00635 [Chryseobacterium sp. FP211-J200]